MLAFRRSLAFLVLLGCSESTTPRPGQEPEVDRPTALLLVERFSPAGRRSFYAMSVNGRFASPLGNVPDDAVQIFPSPDGRTLAWLRDHDDLIHLWLMDHDGDSRRPLLDDERVVRHASWSPDGGRLLVAGSTLEQFDDIWVINVNGTGLVDLTPDPLPAVYSDLFPTWSPDGSRIAFASNRSGTMHLWVMNADGSAKTQLITSTTSERTAAWSPNGTWIGFTGSSSEGGGVGIVQPNGSGYRFFPIAGDVGRIAWLPDNRLLYSTNTTGNYEIFALDVISGVSENLTNHSDHDFRAEVLPTPARAAWLGFSHAYDIATSVVNSPSIASGDVDASGFADVLIADAAHSQIRIYRNNNGMVQPLGVLGALDASIALRALGAADITGDGIDDVVAMGTDNFALFRGSSGGPGVEETHALDGTAHGMAFWDPEGRGSPTVAFAVDRPGEDYRIRAHGHNGAGGVVAVLDGQTEYDRPVGICVGDVTGGGYPDLLVGSSRGAHSLTLFPVLGVSLDQPVVMATGLGLSGSTRQVCADFDGDRRADVALLAPDVLGVSLHLSLGSSFANPGTLGVVGGDALAEDFDHDGDTDLVVASTNGTALVFLRNLGDGRFAGAVRYQLPQRPSRLTAADLDRDGWVDVVTMSAEGLVMVLRNAGRAASP